MNKIAILGATSHIAKNLIFYFKKSGKFKIYLFARSIEKLNFFLRSINYDDANIINLNDFSQETFYAIINCIGVGDPAKLKDIGPDIFSFTEYYDNFIIDYLKNNHDCVYVNFSSGAAYGSDFSSPADESKICKININALNNNYNYCLVKLYSEAKHRSYENLNIVDLRIFAFFSRFIDLNAHYFITGLITCIKKEEIFKTGCNDIIRDFIHPADLFILVNLCISKKIINDVFDAYSLSPITKFEIVNYFADKYGLKYKVEPNILGANTTGIKDNYYSVSKKAENVGYIPEYSSVDCIISEAEEILKLFTK